MRCHMTVAAGGCLLLWSGGNVFEGSGRARKGLVRQRRR